MVGVSCWDLVGLGWVVSNGIVCCNMVGVYPSHSRALWVFLPARRMLHSLLVVCEPGNIFMFYTFAPASLSSAPRMVMGWGDIGGKAGMYQMYTEFEF